MADWKQLQLKGIEGRPVFPLSAQRTQQLLIEAFETGYLHVTSHFKQRGVERNFNIIDTENVIRHGKIVGEPEYDYRHENWRLRIKGMCEGRSLEVRLALDPNVDYECPLLILITAV